MRRRDHEPHVPNSSAASEVYKGREEGRAARRGRVTGTAFLSTSGGTAPARIRAATQDATATAQHVLDIRAAVACESAEERIYLTAWKLMWETFHSEARRQ